MNLQEAYDYTMAVISDLEADGIIVRKRPSKSREFQHVIDKYNSPDRLKPELWYHVSFLLEMPRSRSLIVQAQK